MCYFVEINLTRKALEERFKVPFPEDPRYMSLPFASAFTKPYLPVISMEFPNEVSLCRWGLIPSWVKDEEMAGKILNSTYNARYETVWEKPSFRGGINYRRCMILAHGFFEYQLRGKQKIPYYIRKEDNRPFAFAGISDHWVNQNSGELVISCSILTKPADSFMEKIHNTKKRMPVILTEEGEREWIRSSLSRDDLKEIIHGAAPVLTGVTINKKLITGNVDPGNPDILKPYSYEEPGTLF